MNSKQWTGDQRQCLPSKTIANNWIRTKTNVSYRMNSPCRCLLCSMNFMGIFSIAWTWEKHNSQIDEPNRTRRIPYNNRSSANQKQMSHYLLWLFTLAVLCGMYFWYCHCVIATIIIKMWTMDEKRERERELGWKTGRKVTETSAKISILIEINVIVDVDYDVCNTIQIMIHVTILFVGSNYEFREFSALRVIC